MKESSERVVRFLQGRNDILIMAGDLCTKLKFNEKKLSEYVVGLSAKIKAPVAATGNVISELRGKGIVVKKMWAAEILNDLRGLWQDQILEKKPNVLVLIGYNPEVARRLIWAVHGVIDTIFLGSKFIEQATISLPDSNLKGFEIQMEEIVGGL